LAIQADTVEKLSTVLARAISAVGETARQLTDHLNAKQHDHTQQPLTVTTLTDRGKLFTWSVPGDSAEDR